MSGHNKWSQIKNKKAVTDKRRGQLFSKLLNAVRIAARNDSNPDFNMGLKNAITKAREQNVPQENIDRAILQAKNKELEDLLIEAYGEGGTAIIIIATTDNRNRTIAEIKKILSDADAKMAEPGSVLWAFEKTSNESGDWVAKFLQSTNQETKDRLLDLIDTIQEHDDVAFVYTNIS